MGAHMILRDRVPQITLTAYDESIVFHLMGGLSIADRMTPERVEVKGIKGLVPPWVTIDQKGATEDGTTFVDALYDPIVVELQVKAHGKNPRNLRKVVNHLIASLDAKKVSRLAWFTQELGYWWAPVRWYKDPSFDVAGVATNGQEIGLRLRADKAFWQSFPDVEQFRFQYAAAKDDFNFNDPDDLGTGWTTSLTGGGSGGVKVANGQIESLMSGTRTMVSRKAGYTSSTTNQVVEVQIGTIGQWIFPSNAGVDLWTRMSTTGTPGANGVRVRIAPHLITVSSFNAGVETVLRQRLLLIPPLPGETFTVVAGTEANELFGVAVGGDRNIKVMRNGATLMNFKETTSQFGTAFRGAGLGMYTTGLIPAPSIRFWSVGDNSTVNQKGFIRRINAGDQDYWDTYTCFGPGMFSIGNGPGSTEMVEFGPLMENQVMQIRTDPRKRGVVDLTSTPTTPQQKNIFLQAINDFINFATGNNVPPLLQEIESLFGIVPPQGNPYTLMHGRFSAPIPAKSPGKPAVPYFIKVAIDDGNADSKIIASGTPLRRNPY